MCSNPQTGFLVLAFQIYILLSDFDFYTGTDLTADDLSQGSHGHLLWFLRTK